jgi:hypothetical protein
MSLGPDTGFLGDSAAANALRWSDVWCGWSGNHVIMHITLHNTFGAHVTPYVSPAYTLRNAGTHGDSSNVFVHLAAHGRRSWAIDAGIPKAVAGHPPLSGCSPSVDWVDLGYTS